jgi:hypothetical protein
MSWFKDWENFVRGKTDSKFGKKNQIVSLVKKQIVSLVKKHIVSLVKKTYSKFGKKNR